MTLVTASIVLLMAHLVWTWVRAARAVGAPLGATDAVGPGATVCVVVPAWNDGGVLLETLAALAPEITGAPTGSRVVIVAGGADDEFARAAKAVAEKWPSWRVLRQEPRGKNAALNQAIEACDSEILVFLDADTHVRQGWLDSLIAPILAGVADATSGRFEAKRSTAVASVFEMDQLVSQQVHGADVLFGGASIAVHRRVLDAIGGRLPEEVLVGVDWDLSERVTLAGLRRRFVPSAGVVTEVPQTWHDYWKTEVRWRRAVLVASWRRWRRGRDAGSAVALVYPPIAHAVLLGGWIVLPLLGSPFGMSGSGLLLWCAFVIWFVGRTCSRCLVAFRADGDLRWLRLIPTYAAALCVTSAASWVALLSFDQLDPHFKGRRSVGAS